MNKILKMEDYEILESFFSKNSFNFIKESAIDKLKNGFYFAQMHQEEIKALIIVNEVNIGLKIMFKNPNAFILENSLDYLKSFNKQIYLLDVSNKLKEFYIKNGFYEKEKLIKYQLEPYKVSVDIELHRAQKDHLEKLVTIDQLAFGKFWEQGEKSLKHYINYDEVNFLIYKVNENIITYAIHDHKYINRLAVLPEFHGKGIGKKILQKIINNLWENGVKTVSLNTQITNEKARFLYENIGFKEIERSYVLSRI